MKVAVYTQKNSPDTVSCIRDFISEIESRNVIPVLHEDIRHLKDCKNSLTFSSKKDLAEQKVEFLFTFGGDGTILGALTLVQDLEIPIIGVNTGRLGFLANFNKSKVFSKLDGILNGEMEVIQRSIIQVKGLDIDFPFALNEVDISRNETTSMITVRSYINEEFLNVFWGDGLIVSTPTGSTAYSLSCGGPIISPENKNFVITPISPHNLNVRPIVLNDNVKIRLKVDSRVPQFTMSLDSRLYHVDISNEIYLEKANFTLSLVQPNNISFFETLRKKLLWGNDKRN